MLFCVDHVCSIEANSTIYIALLSMFVSEHVGWQSQEI